MTTTDEGTSSAIRLALTRDHRSVFSQILRHVRSNGMADRLNPATRRARRRRELRVLTRFGDELIHSIRTKKPTTLWVPTAPTRGDEVDVRVRAPRPGETLAAYFNCRDDHRLVPIRLQVTDQQVNDSSLEVSPLTRPGEK